MSLFSHASSGIASMARWASALRVEQIPSAVADIALDCLIDTYGVMAAGSSTALAQRARSLPAADGPCVVAGTAQRCDARHAALFNGVAAHALDFDDNCYAGFVHGSAVIAPAALAVAQWCDASGADLLTAFVAGAECEYALGLASDNVLYQRGWWSSGVLGPVGAAVAAAHLLRLDAARMAAAIGIAVCGAAGLKAGFGTDAKAFMAGRAAEAGVTAALMAQAGASGPLDALEHPNGFFRLFNDGQALAQVFQGLGHNWSLLQPGVDVKRIPVCLSSHAAVDAVQILMAEHTIDVAQIDAIVCDVPPIVIANLVHDAPTTPQQAQFSMPFAIAVSVLYGTLGLEHLSSATLAKPALQALMRKVTMHTGAMWRDAALCAAAPEGAQVSIVLADGRTCTGLRDAPRGAAPEGAQVSIVLADGRTCTGLRDAPRGAARYRLGRAELDAKFESCLRFAKITTIDSASWLAQLHDLPQRASVRALMA